MTTDDVRVPSRTAISRQKTAKKRAVPTAVPPRRLTGTGRSRPTMLNEEEERGVSGSTREELPVGIILCGVG